MEATEVSLPAALGERARQKPDTPAYTFVDYEIDPEGYSQTVTWSELYQRVRAVAGEIVSCTFPGDRVAILTPQGLEFVIGFYAATEAGCIAVPLPAPQFGAHDERAAAALQDSAPTVLVTTSAVVDDVVSCARALPGTPPAVIEIDVLDLDAQPTLRSGSRPPAKTALLQYTSGSTRSPAAVVVSHKNIFANIFANVEQVIADYFEADGKAPPADLTLVSWLPTYHDMGLLLGVTGALTIGLHSVVMSPMAFLQRPARWMQQLAKNSCTFTAVPNFAFELAARRTTDADMAGLDLSHVHTVLSGSERVHAATIRRFLDRFANFNFPESALKPSYGPAEAMVYVASSDPGRPPTVANFDYEKLSAGHAEACDNESGVQLVSVGTPRASTIRIVDPDTRVENPAGMVGEIWLHGDNIANGYWRKPQLSQRTFGGQLVDPSTDTPTSPWLRTGDLGVIYDGELFVIGRIEDLLIVDGRNHYPDDIEATTQEISGGRVAAISIPADRTERLAVIAETKNRGHSEDEMQERLRTVRAQVASAISKSHGLRVSDLVLVPPGSIPITTSGKIRPSSCLEAYRQDEFSRLDSAA
ncbi:AMP-binding protein [Candidatus Mycobacterium methanotrophicum]|uniref:AMP-binding protein n=1 Tax=Candidatus Mycobacterium methanotrophicum TaxID=2943498 RepID=A0ABY4QFT9_9MYCO|nr:AMP-binding protein [Candidatus Mycobacterium methanotrophicum]UQX09689.1 AMP-binding protein [Candidatus Mycobacterium methanotrophicum]